MLSLIILKNIIIDRSLYYNIVVLLHYLILFCL